MWPQLNEVWRQNLNHNRRVLLSLLHESYRYLCRTVYIDRHAVLLRYSCSFCPFRCGCYICSSDRHGTRDTFNWRIQGDRFSRGRSVYRPGVDWIHGQVEVCDVNVDGQNACSETQRWTRPMLMGSGILYAIGTSFAYVIPYFLA